MSATAAAIVAGTTTPRSSRKIDQYMLTSARNSAGSGSSRPANRAGRYRETMNAPSTSRRTPCRRSEPLVIRGSCSLSIADHATTAIPPPRVNSARCIGSTRGVVPVLWPDHVLEEHVSGVGGGPERHERCLGASADCEYSREDAQRSDQQERDGLEPGRLIQHRLRQGVPNRIGNEGPEQRVGNQAQPECDQRDPQPPVLAGRRDSLRGCAVSVRRDIHPNPLLGVATHLVRSPPGVSDLRVAPCLFASFWILRSIFCSIRNAPGSASAIHT